MALPASGGAESWRDGLSHRAVVLSLPVMLIGTVIAVCLGVSVAQRIALAAVSTIVFVAFAVERRMGVLSGRQRSWLVVAGVTILGCAGFATFGPLSGPAAAAMCASVLAGVLLGRRAVFVVVLVLLTVNVVLAFGMELDAIPGPSLLDVDPRAPNVWLRTVSVALVIVVLVGFVVASVVEELESALARSQAEVSRREAAEIARDKERAIANRAQKLEAIGRLAASVAHDFNNSLAVIQTWTTMLERSKNEAERNEAVGSIADATKQAAALASQLLVLGRRNARSPHNLRLETVVTAHANSVGRLLTSEFVLELNVDPEVEVFADEVQLHQILLNLTLNARDAMARGGRIGVGGRTEVLEVPRDVTTGSLVAGSYAVLSVEDTGVGMDVATQEQALEPFFTTKPAGRGTGLGLSSVVSIAAQSGGQVELVSEPGRGTCVEVWLPARGTDPVASPVAPALQDHP